MDKFAAVVLIMFLFLGAFQLTTWICGITLDEKSWKCTEYSELKNALIGDQKYQICTQYSKVKPIKL